MELASLETVFRGSRIYIALCMNRLRTLASSMDIFISLRLLMTLPAESCGSGEISRLQLTLCEALPIKEATLGTSCAYQI